MTKTTIVEISIGSTTIRIETPASEIKPVRVETSKGESDIEETVVKVERKPRASGYTIQDRAPDHCSQCGSEGRRCNHDLGGCIDCR